MTDRGGGERPQAPPRCWLGRVEIPAADPARAARFYTEALGWGARQTEGGDTPYFDLVAPDMVAPDMVAPDMVAKDAPAGVDADSRSESGGDSGAAPRAGVTTAPVLGAAHPLAVIHVDGELAPVLARITAAGGSTNLRPTPVPGHGTFARFRDPDGNLLGLWSIRDPSTRD